MEPEIWVALIAAIPATIGAIAAIRNRRTAKKQLTPSNGTSLVKMIEDIWDEINYARDHRKMLDELLVTHSERIETIEDRFKYVCPRCLTLLDAESPH